jgi:hypothetical protein
LGLRIFPEHEDAPARRPFADDIVGRLRSGYQIGGRPAALTEWRVTTGDPDVAAFIASHYGGDPQEWEATGEDNLEVFTNAPSLDVILDGPEALHESLVLWGRNGKPIYRTDGVTKDDGSPDPDASLTLAERKERARQGIGPVPDIRVDVRLADDPDLGVFEFRSSSWSFASDLDYNNVEADLIDADGPVKATLALEPVSFIAKGGPRAGQTVSYTKPTLRLKGLAAGVAAKPRGSSDEPPF